MSEPAWWIEALELEARDELAAAERKLQEAIPHLGCYAQIAHLYELRLQRKWAAGDRPAAEEAARRSNDWMRTMAAGATSGGEGAALSAEADEHEARLRRLLQTG